MTDLYVWLAVAVLVAATWIAALKLSLIGPSRAVVTMRLEDRGRAEAAAWLSRKFDAAIFALSLVRTIGQFALFALVLAETVQLAERRCRECRSRRMGRPCPVWNRKQA